MTEARLSIPENSLFLSNKNNIFLDKMQLLQSSQEEWKHFLDVVNYLSTVFATAIVFIDIIKIGFINFELEDMVP